MMNVCMLGIRKKNMTNFAKRTEPIGLLGEYKNKKEKKHMENKITITVDEYKSLLLLSAKAAIIKDLLARNKYVSTDDLKVILDIEETGKENNNETV